jgi:hypothetical protein
MKVNSRRGGPGEGLLQINGNVGDIKADEQAAEFWGQEAAQPGFRLQMMEESARTNFLRSIDKIDPFSLKVE